MEKIFCTYCGKYHPPGDMVDVKPSSALCISCDTSLKAKKKNIKERRRGNETFDEGRYKELMEKVRYKGAIRVKGYKFKGTIPEPKSEAYYKYVTE